MGVLIIRAFLFGGLYWVIVPLQSLQVVESMVSKSFLIKVPRAEILTSERTSRHAGGPERNNLRTCSGLISSRLWTVDVFSARKYEAGHVSS